MKTPSEIFIDNLKEFLSNKFNIQISDFQDFKFTNFLELVISDSTFSIILNLTDFHVKLTSSFSFKNSKPYFEKSKMLINEVLNLDDKENQLAIFLKQEKEKLERGYSKFMIDNNQKVYHNFIKFIKENENIERIDYLLRNDYKIEFLHIYYNLFSEPQNEIRKYIRRCTSESSRVGKDNVSRSYEVISYKLIKLDKKRYLAHQARNFLFRNEEDRINHINTNIDKKRLKDDIKSIQEKLSLETKIINESSSYYYGPLDEDSYGEEVDLGIDIPMCRKIFNYENETNLSKLDCDFILYLLFFEISDLFQFIENEYGSTQFKINYLIFERYFHFILIYNNYKKKYLVWEQEYNNYKKEHDNYRKEFKNFKDEYDSNGLRDLMKDYKKKNIRRPYPPSKPSSLYFTIKKQENFLSSKEYREIESFIEKKITSIIDKNLYENIIQNFLINHDSGIKDYEIVFSLFEKFKSYFNCNEI